MLPTPQAAQIRPTRPRSPGARLNLLLAALLLASLVVPRVLMLRGLESAAPVAFGDMYAHLVNLEILSKTVRLPESEFAPYPELDPGALEPLRPTRWPHGLYYAALPFHALFGPLSIWTIQAPNILFSLLLAAGLILLGRRLHSLSLGLLAALLASLTPPLLGGSFYFNLEYPLAAMVVWALLLLHRTDGFSRHGDSLALGVLCALGLFVKLTFALHLFVPALVALVLGLRGGRRRRVLVNAGLALVVVVGLTVGLQWSALAQVGEELGRHLLGPAHDDFQFEMARPGTLLWFVQIGIFAVHSYPWPLLIPVGLGTALALARRCLPRTALLVATLVGTYILLTLVANKMERYSHPIYPLLPLTALLAATVFVPRRLWLVLGAALVALHVGVTAAVFQRPTPWGLGEREAELGWMYEISIPGPEVRQGLRQNRQHNRGNFDDVVLALRTLLRDHPEASGPLALATRLGRSTPLFENDRRDLHNFLYLLVAQHAGPRLVVYDGVDMARLRDVEPPLSRRLSLAPVLLVITGKGVLPTYPEEPFELLGRRIAEVPFDGTPVPVGVSLYRRRGSTRNP